MIDAVPGVVEAAVIGTPHPDLGEAVVAVVVPSAKQAATPDTVAQAIAPDLARYKQPKAILILDELPRNAMGKVQKNVLRDQYRALFVKSD